MDFLLKINENCEHLQILIKEKDKTKNDNMFSEIFNVLALNNNNNNKSIKYLNLSSNTFYSLDPLNCLKKFMFSENSLKLKKLNLQNFIFKNKESFNNEVYDLSKFEDNFTLINTSLVHLDLSKAFIDLSLVSSITKNLIEELKTNNLKILNLKFNNIDNQCLVIFSDYLLSSKYCKLESLDLGYNYIGDEGCALVSEFLLNNKTIKVLKLGHNSIYDYGMQLLSNGIVLSRSLESVDLSDNYIGELGVKNLSLNIKVLNESSETKLKALDFHWNKISSKGLEILTDFYVFSANTLEELLLGDNKINDSSASFLFKSLKQQQQCRNIKIINFYMNNLEAESMFYLSELIKEQDYLEELILNRNSINNKGLIYLCDGLTKNAKNLRILGLAKNNLSNDAVNSLADALFNNFTIEEIDLSENKISNLESFTKKVFKKRCFQKLNLGHNSLDEEAGLEIGLSLPFALGIKKLILNSNKLKDKGAISLAEGILSNSSLEELNLEYNYIGDEGINALSNSILYRSNFTDLNVSCNLFTKVGASNLAKILTNLEYVNFSSNPFCNQAVKFLLDGLQTNFIINKVRITNSQIGSIDNSFYLSNALSKNKQIKKFDFGYSGFDFKSAKLIFPLLINNKIIKFLDFKNNNLQDEGAVELSLYLKSAISLKQLFLQTNNIGKLGCLAIAEALKFNKSLIELNICGNPITSAGAKAICTSLLESNQTLQEIYLNYCQLDEYCACELANLIKRTKYIKVLTLYGNNLNNAGIKMVFRALKYNKSILHIYIGNNNFDDDALSDITEVLKYNNTLLNLEINSSKLSKKAAFKIAKGIKYNSSLVLVNLINNLIDHEGIYKLINAIKTKYKINELKCLLNPVNDEFKKLILMANPHVKFN